MSRWLSLLLAGCCGFSLDLAAAAARADAAECNTAYVETQQRRRAGELRAARLAALRCAQDACSVTVRRHCGEWLEDLDEAMPSIVIDARDAAGNELADVRAFVDDELLTEHLNGHALPIDPGEHELRFEHADAVQTRRLLVLEGQAYRRVSVRFEPARAEPTPPLAASPRAPALGRPTPSRSLAPSPSRRSGSRASGPRPSRPSPCWPPAPTSTNASSARSVAERATPSASTPSAIAT